MGPATALNVRRLGQIVELVCLAGVVMLRRRNLAEPELILGVPAILVFQIGLGVGFVIWCVGTIAYRRARQRGEI